MKAFVAASLIALLSSTALGAPSTVHYGKRQSDPSVDAVENAINAWNFDVDTVNNFLNNAPSQSPSELQQAAEVALSAAQNEPTQLGVLASISDFSDDQQYQGAVLNLQEVFGNVPSSLQNIINDPGNAESVSTQLLQINNVRCCNVLPDLDILWQDAADDYGISNIVNTAVPRPNACATTDC